MIALHYYIDGYNLLFRTLKAGDEFKKKREEITLDLETKLSALRIDATIVFDSQYTEDDVASSHYKSLKIIFTALKQTADDFILQELKRSPDPSQNTVVTSDKKLAFSSRLRLAKTESVEEFFSWVNRRIKNKLKEKKQLLKPSKEPLQERLPPPKPTPAPKEEGSFDYYLDAFEANAKDIEKSEKFLTKRSKLKTSIPKADPKKKSKTSEESHESDMERWRRAFERNVPDP